MFHCQEVIKKLARIKCHTPATIVSKSYGGRYQDPRGMQQQFLVIHGASEVRGHTWQILAQVVPFMTELRPKCKINTLVLSNGVS